MGRRARAMAWVVVLLAPTMMVLSSAPAHASCAEPEPMAGALTQAEAVFIGTVTALDFDGRVATFAVDEVWKGDVDETALVNGSGERIAALQSAESRGETLWTSVDRTFEAGTRYLVVAYGRDGATLLDSACSLTQPYTPALVEHRPSTAHPPVAAAPPAVLGGEEPGGAMWAWIAMVGVVAAGIGWLAVRQLHKRRTVRNAIW